MPINTRVNFQEASVAFLFSAVEMAFMCAVGDSVYCTVSTFKSSVTVSFRRYLTYDEESANLYPSLEGVALSTDAYLNLLGETEKILDVFNSEPKKNSSFELYSKTLGPKSRVAVYLPQDFTDRSPFLVLIEKEVPKKPKQKIELTMPQFRKWIEKRAEIAEEVDFRMHGTPKRSFKPTITLGENELTVDDEPKKKMKKEEKEEEGEKVKKDDKEEKTEVKNLYSSICALYLYQICKGKLSCSGCLTADGSQLGHECMMVTECDRISIIAISEAKKLNSFNINSVFKSLIALSSKNVDIIPEMVSEFENCFLNTREGRSQIYLDCLYFSENKKLSRCSEFVTCQILNLFELFKN